MLQIHTVSNIQFENSILHNEETQITQYPNQSSKNYNQSHRSSLDISYQFRFLLTNIFNLFHFTFRKRNQPDIFGFHSFPEIHTITTQFTSKKILFQRL